MPLYLKIAGLMIIGSIAVATTEAVIEWYDKKQK